MVADTSQDGHETGGSASSKAEGKTPPRHPTAGSEGHRASDIQDRSEALKDAPGGFGTALEKMKGDKVTSHKGSK